MKKLLLPSALESLFAVTVMYAEPLLFCSLFVIKVLQILLLLLTHPVLEATYLRLIYNNDALPPLSIENIYL